MSILSIIQKCQTWRLVWQCRRLENLSPEEALWHSFQLCLHALRLAL